MKIYKNDKIQENEVHAQFKTTYLTQQKCHNHGANNLQLILIRENQIKSYYSAKEEYRLQTVYANYF